MVRVPTQIGRYRVERILGTGGFSSVFLATDEALDAPVAIKVLAENWAFDPDVHARFIGEARLMRAVHDRHLAPVHDIGSHDDGRPYFVMDHADRGTLQERLDAREAGTQPAAGAARRVVGALASALGALHAAGIVHRDIKPSNMLLRSAPGRRADIDGDGVLADDEVLQLSDLGLAKDLGLASGLTVSAGTPGYSAPEQLWPGAAIDHRVDLHAATALVVHVLLGAPPEPGAHGSRLPDGAEALPGPVREVLLHGLAADPDDRPPDVATWAAELNGALRRIHDAPPAAVGAATGPDAADPGPAGGASDTAAARGRGRGRVLTAAATVVAVAVAAAVLLLGGEPGPTVVGPAEVPVGETATYTSEPPPDAEVVRGWWIDWDGQRVDGDVLRVTATGPGTLTFERIVVTSDGVVRRTRHTIELVADGGAAP